MKYAKIIPTEQEEQIAFVKWLDWKGIRFASIPNGGSRNIIEAKNLKRAGVRAGFPDLFIPIPIESNHGLFIEMKRKEKSKLSLYQIEWMNFLRSMGYKCEVAYGCEQAIKIVEEYFKM